MLYKLIHFTFYIQQILTLTLIYTLLKFTVYKFNLFSLFSVSVVWCCSYKL